MLVKSLKQFQDSFLFFWFPINLYFSQLVLSYKTFFRAQFENNFLVLS